ncbi:MAG: pyruvate ferredoxin oxidoreductase [Aquificota bacterium]|nr:MAG: pyruvate ferredoxin oxidoreductase [Aquificota bacterium]
MAKRTGIEVSIAIAEAARQANVDVVSAYPITPQTHIVEHLAQLVADGDLDAEYITVESEHTAMSACVGASAAGARVFTSTSSQGLALMNEIVYLASSLRTPVVMALANRSLSGPISIWNDHSDVMNERDTGWISIFANNGQEAYDLTLMAFRIGEDRRVMLPVMINFDGFILTHVIEPMYIFDDEEIADFIPPYEPVCVLDTDNPITMGPVGVPDVYTEAKKQQEIAIRESRPIIEEVFEEFAQRYGRRYEPVETYKADDAEIVLLAQGSVIEAAEVAVDLLREQGRKVGAVELRLWRPFPFDALREVLCGTSIKQVVVLDRCISFGGPIGPVLSEVRSALYLEKDRPMVVGVVAGLGGRDISLEEYVEMFDVGEECLRTGKDSGEETDLVRIVGLRE